MHFIFLTRCFTTKNLQRIKDDIKAVFSGSKHTYQHVLLVDMSHALTKDDPTTTNRFDAFVDNNTKVHYVYNKKDYYMYYACDDYLATLEDQDAYVYFLDDDNTLKPDFIKVCDTSENIDLIIFKLDNHPHWGNVGCTEGNVDIGNYITKLNVIKEYKIGDVQSRSSDGLFVEKLRKNKRSILYINETLGYYKNK